MSILTAADLMFDVPFQSFEFKRQESIQKDKQRLEEAQRKKQIEEQEFAKQTAEKLNQKVENITGNRENQIKALQDRLKDHVSHHRAFYSFLLLPPT